ncbi:DNA translocase FtsK [Streptomyces sp. DH12]|uniref:DNA translocase FtsK n=1 Tax=Streptomyces sp. DH12 TaxID=2857010 RepID=UPI0027E10DFC|nr:DNA translocase FtsK [Streptomyces sp. DH12]
MFTRPRNHEPIPWRHAVISTPLYTAATVYTGGLALGVAEDLGATLPISWMALGSAAGVCAAAASRWIRTAWTTDGTTTHPTPRARRWYHTGFTATWTTAAYAWLTYTAHHTPWSLASTTAIALGAAALTPAYATDRFLRQDVIAAQWAAEAAADAPADLNEWELLFQQAGARGVEVLKPYDTRNGYALPLKLTQTPYEGVLGLLRTIETRKGDLRSGSLDLRPGDSGLASDAILYVATRNVLDETVNLPDEHHPLTITEPLTLGILESGEPFEVRFRQNSVFIAGKKGSGKSVLLHVVISVVSRCTDAVVWMIDMAEGNTAKRWIRPWAEGWKDSHGRLIDRPVLDWVATSVDEAVRLLQASVAVADGRARRMKGSKIRPTAQCPALVVITDENPVLMSRVPNAIQAKIDGIKKGRKAAVDYIDAAQRGTGPNSGGGEIMSQYDTVIGGRFPKKQEGQFVFPDYYQRVDLSKLPGNGAFYVLDEQRSKTGMGPEKLKAYFTYDDDEHPDGTEATVIEQLSVDRWNIRPDLDPDSQADAEPFGYSTRWNPDRITWLLDALNMPTPDTTSPAADPRPARTTGGPMPTLPTLQSYIDRGKQYAQKAAPAPEPDEATIDRVLSEAEALTRQAAVSLTKPAKKDTRHPRRDQCIAWVRDAGPDGITVAEVRARLEQLYPGETPPSDTAIQNWYGAHDHITKPRRGTYVWTEQDTAADPEPAPAETADVAEGTEPDVPAEDPALLALAVEQVITTQFASRAMLQRKLRVGWDTTGTLLDQLQQLGVVGPEQGDARSRQVLAGPDDLETILARIRPAQG